jgi:hypothetical protein
MFVKLSFALAAFVVFTALSSCAMAPTHPSLITAALPALIPVRDFVADRESTGGFLSKCLGGRSSGFDCYQLGAWAF